MTDNSYENINECLIDIKKFFRIRPFHNVNLVYVSDLGLFFQYLYRTYHKSTIQTADNMVRNKYGVSIYG